MEKIDKEVQPNTSTKRTSIDSTPSSSTGAKSEQKKDKACVNTNKRVRPDSTTPDVITDKQPLKKQFTGMAGS